MAGIVGWLASLRGWLRHPESGAPRGSAASLARVGADDFLIRKVKALRVW